MMKKILIGIILLMTTSVWAQQPQKVYSITKEIQAISWYKDQQKAWEKVIADKPTNGDAWINYYATARALRNLTTGEERNEYLDLCKSVVEKCEKALPNSFEFHYLNYREQGAWNGGDELLKAEKIRPNAPELIEELMIYYELQRNMPKHREYAQQMFDANEMSAGQLNWGHNVLSELDQNAILFTHGDNDTYSVWIASAVNKFRQDVTIINTSLMRVEDYRNRLLKDMNLPAFDQKLSKLSTQQEYHEVGNNIVHHIMKSNRPIYIAGVSSRQFEDEFGDSLYLVGLTYKYCNYPLDNTAIIKRNYEKRYLLDYLTHTFSYHIANNQAKNMNGTYLPSMIKLYQHYAASEDTIKQEELKNLLLVVAKGAGKEEEVLKMLSAKN